MGIAHRFVTIDDLAIEGDLTTGGDGVDDGAAIGGIMCAEGDNARE